MAGEEESNGFDVLGNFNSTKIRWDPSEVGFSTELRTYQEESVIVFTQRFQVSDAIVMWPTSCRGLELGDKVGMCPPSISNLQQSRSGYFISSSGQSVSKFLIGIHQILW